MIEGKYKVPIRNLFCMFCYAHETPELIKSFSGDDEDLPQFHLLADLFIKETEGIMMRGLIRDYHEHTEETNQLSGKISFERSMNYIIHKKPALICEQDQFDENILINQILKATLNELLKVENLSKRQKSQIYLQLLKLQHITTIKLLRQHFIVIRLNRNNMRYQQMLQLSRFIFECKNLSDEEGSFNLVKVINDDRKMQVIFEKFILNFYRYEQDQFLSKSERMKWKMFGSNNALLPDMKTDISLIDKLTGQKIIIEAKYYADVLLKSFQVDKIRSGHLYQLFTYLNHSSDVYLSRGILVYPTNGVKVDETYTIPIQVGSEIKESTIRIFTIDLNQKWRGIYDQMFELLKSQLMTIAGDSI